MRSSTPLWLWKLDAEHRLLIALGVAIGTFVNLPKNLEFGTRAVITWDASVGTLLLLIWSVILTAHPRQIRHRAQTDDTNRLVVTVLIVSAASASLFAILLLLRISKQLPPAEEALAVGLSVVAVVCAWLIVHTTFCVRYAHHYYSNLGQADLIQPDSTQAEEAALAGGLEFPNLREPDYLDFAYFAFTIGVAAQVSDVQVTSRLMRRMVLLHSVLAFLFNTVLVALSINIVSQLF
ncbi:DUF1345 domain-containing protein [Phormidium tenue FACHB-886]|nr:DUF1345 domain-containing protein [Phormidium tenue FACHB-886]